MEVIPAPEETFDAMRFIDEVAAVSRRDAKMPDPEKSIGRECYAFSEEEDKAFGVAESAARDILRILKEGQDFEIRKSPIGNMYITLKAAGSNSPPIWTGSHLDSVADGGKYDGVAGVAMGLEMMSKFVHQRVPLKRNFTVAVFRSEESSPRNSYGCLGSAIDTGLIHSKQLDSIQYDSAMGISLKDHFTTRYGAEKWKEVKASLSTRFITKDAVGAYIELHIEQSRVTSTNDKHLGIVVGGIGGARREAGALKLTPEIVDTAGASYKKVSLIFRGEPNHTGGTPPNPAFYRTPGIVWYRNDALVGASNVTNKLLHDRSIKLLAFKPREATGFTSIPALQFVELLVPSDVKNEDMEARLSSLGQEVREKMGVEMAHSVSEYAENSAEIVPGDRVRQIVNIPQVISSLSTKAFNSQGTETGTTRATVTDFFLAPDGLTFNLDLREVNEDHLMELITKIHSRAHATLGGSLRHISAKVHSPVDPAITERLQEHARRLGLSFVLMPSGPGHDADRISAIGIPVGMVFVRQQDGLSHNPNERMSEKDYKQAAAVMYGAVHSMLTE